MRRSDKEIHEMSEIIAILDTCAVCRIGLLAGSVPYIVPMVFGYAFEDGVLVLLFHSASEGRKIELLKDNPNVCFEMDCGCEIITGETACRFSMAYRSIIGTGRAAFIHGEAEKRSALNKIMKKIYYGEPDYDVTILQKACVFKVIVSELSAKENHK